MTKPVSKKTKSKSICNNTGTLIINSVLTIESGNIIIISKSPDKERNESIPQSNVSPLPPPLVFPTPNEDDFTDIIEQCAFSDSGKDYMNTTV